MSHGPVKKRRPDRPFSKGDYWQQKAKREKAREKRPALDVPTVTARNAESKTLFENFAGRCTLRRPSGSRKNHGTPGSSVPETKGECKLVRRIMRSLGNLENLTYSQRKYLELTERRSNRKPKRTTGAMKRKAKKAARRGRQVRAAA